MDLFLCGIDENIKQNWGKTVAAGKGMGVRGYKVQPHRMRYTISNMPIRVNQIVLYTDNLPGKESLSVFTIKTRRKVGEKGGKG